MGQDSGRAERTVVDRDLVNLSAEAIGSWSSDGSDLGDLRAPCRSELLGEDLRDAIDVELQRLRARAVEENGRDVHPFIGETASVDAIDIVGLGVEAEEPVPAEADASGVEGERHLPGEVWSQPIHPEVDRHLVAGGEVD